MRKAKYLLILFVFLIFLAGCLAGCKKNGLENRIFIVLDWADIDKTDMAKVFVKEKNISNWNLNLVLIESKRAVPEIGEEVKVCFLEYFSDNRGRWESIPVIKH